MADARTQARLERLQLHVDDLSKDLKVLRTLVEHDHASALNKIRYITEKVLLGLCRQHDVDWGKRSRPTLERMIGPLVAQDIVPSNIAIHVRTIQTNASPGSHFQEDPLTETHVRVAEIAMLDFLEWWTSERPSLVGILPDEPPTIPARREPPRTLRTVALVAGVAAVSGIGVWAVTRSPPEPPLPDTAAAPAQTEAAEPADEPAEPEPEPEPVDAEGWQLGNTSSLTEAVAVWKRLRREGQAEGVTLLHIGDDEFALLAPESADRVHAARVAQLVDSTAAPWSGLARARLTPTAQRTTVPLNIRRGESTEHLATRILSRGTIVVAITGNVDNRESKLEDGEWAYLVASGNDVGWSAARFLEEHDGCIPEPDLFLDEAPSSRVDVIRRDTIVSRDQLYTGARSEVAYVFLARDPELDRSHVGVFPERNGCQLTRRHSATIDGFVEAAYMVETLREGGETLLLTAAHPDREPPADGMETWRAYQLTRIAPVWEQSFRTGNNLSREQRQVVITGGSRSPSGPGHWPVLVRNRDADDLFFRWNGQTLVVDPQALRPPAPLPPPREPEKASPRAG